MCVSSQKVESGKVRLVDNRELIHVCESACEGNNVMD